MGRDRGAPLLEAAMRLVAANVRPYVHSRGYWGGKIGWMNWDSGSATSSKQHCEQWNLANDHLPDGATQ